MTRRRAAALVAALMLAACGSDGVDGVDGSASDPTAEQPVDGGVGAGGTMPATAFPLTSVLVAAERTLPSDVSIGEIPRNTRWLPGNRIEVPLLRDGVAATLTVTVLPGQQVCAAASDLLSEAEQDAVAVEVCAVWEGDGRLPVVVPDPDAPMEVDPSDAAR